MLGEPPGSRRRELDELGDGARAPLLGEPEQREQDLGRRLRVGERAMAGPHGRPEELGERAEPDAGDPALEQAAREPHGVDHRRCEPPPGQPLHLDVEEAEVEAGVVRDEDGVARELEEAPHRELGRWRAAQRGRLDPRERRDRRRQRPPRVDERLEGLRQLELADPNGADLADPGGPGRSPVVSRSTTT